MLSTVIHCKSTSIHVTALHADYFSLKPERIIVFVGHDAKQDFQYLKRLNVDLSQINNIKDILDSSNMYQSLRRELNGSSLSKTLLHLDMVGCNLHNGGNDAVYTLRAMLGIAIKAKVDKKELREQHELELEKRMEAEKDHRSKVVRMQKEGWDLDSDDDGGEPGNPFAQFGPKQSTQMPPKPKVMDTVKRPWTGDLAKNVPNARDGNVPPLPARPAWQHEQEQLEADFARWRPGINVVDDEDIHLDKDEIKQVSRR